MGSCWQRYRGVAAGKVGVGGRVAEAAEVTEQFDFNCLPCIPASCIP